MATDKSSKNRVICLALGKLDPDTGMEKHFLQAIQGKARACTAEEKEWVSIWEEYQLAERNYLDYTRAKHDPRVNVDLSKKRTKDKIEPPKINKNISTQKPQQVKHKNESSGCCVDCGQEIPLGRIEALPGVTRCAACQEKLEQGHPELVQRKVDEGLSGSREDHKKMRGKLYSDMRKRRYE